ncbi:type VI secretion protein [Boseaceae bacterium BT-24-1]|nr:type VI secretion protein [Boseaceae bacterium BT-24-1]
MRIWIIAAVAALAFGFSASGADALVPAGFQACGAREPGTKERLDCYDALMPPAPKAKPSTATKMEDCRFKREEDERLACFDFFMTTRLPP